MSAQIIDGKAIASNFRASLKKEIDALKHQTGQSLRVVSLVIGDDAGSQSYALSQQRTAEALGIHYELQRFSADTPLMDVLEFIEQLNSFEHIHGVILNKPLPPQIDFNACINAISSQKDIEGMGVSNLGRLFLGKSKILPCTPASAMTLLRSIGMDLKGKEAVVVGRSEIVGKPIALLLLEENVTTTICHSATSQAGKLDEHLKRADIVIAAIGKPLFVKGDWIKPGAVVIDVGINQVNGHIVGDVDFESAVEKAAYITPVPGGVGPVTSVMLMRNAVEAYKQQFNL